MANNQNIPPTPSQCQNCEALKKQVAVLNKTVEELNKKIDELTARLNRNSSNSSKPPSSDPPWLLRDKKKPSGRRPGGQQGHPGSFRELLPEEDMSEIVNHFAPQCGHCGSPELVCDSGVEPIIHQIAELPPVSVYWTEHRLHLSSCRGCGQQTQAALPQGAPRGMLGPRLQSGLALLTGRYRMSRREATQAFEDLFGVDISLGAVSSVEHRVSEALAVPVDEARAYVRSADIVNQDETGWRQENRKAWLWTAVTPSVTVFHINAKRNSDVVLAMLGNDFLGHIGTDRWSAYGVIPMERRQICHSHLDRDYRKIAEFGKQTLPIGSELLKLQKQVFEVWGNFKEGSFSRTEMQSKMKPIESTMETILRAATTCGHAKTEGMSKNILKHWPAVFNFTRTPGLEPTNNSAERALRPAVLWRKGSFGTQSLRGSQFVERMLTVYQTCRQQGRSVFEFVTSAVQAAMTGEKPPTLLPPV